MVVLRRRLSLHTGDTAHEVLDDEILRGLSLDQDAACWTIVIWLGGRTQNERDLALQV